MEGRGPVRKLLQDAERGCWWWWFEPVVAVEMLRIGKILDIFEREKKSRGGKEEIHPFPFSLVSHVKDSVFAPPFAFYLLCLISTLIS